MTKLDEQRIRLLEADMRYRDFEWQSELQEFKKTKRRTELESFSAHGLTAIVDKYLPKKLKMIEDMGS